jgi:hypothetical protein
MKPDWSDRAGRQSRLSDSGYGGGKGQMFASLADHGPMLAEFMPGMIHTYRGGCTNASPCPGVFPATALGDGEVGPNICRLYQAAVLAP